MSVGHSSNPRRYLAVWLPWLSADRLARTRRAASPEAVDRPIVFIETSKGALRLAAVDPAAARLGLEPGLTLADARARVPDIETVAHDPDADAALLTRLIEDFDRFTPMIAADPPQGLILDVAGCAHLFGDEAGLVAAVRTRALKAGLQVRTALASSPQSARALCRFGTGGCFSASQAREAVRRLPVAALEGDPRETQALRRAGLKRIADLDDRPRAPLAARFGAGFPARLSRVLGDEDVRFTPHRPCAPILAERVFFEPVTTTEDVERVLSDLLADVRDQLDQAGQGGRRFTAGFFRLDGHVRRVTVGTGLPSRDEQAVLRLFRERLAALETPLDPGFGFDQIRMEVPEAQTLKPAQILIDGPPEAEEALARLVDRLTARLGPMGVRRVQPVGSHLPERSETWGAAAAAAGAGVCEEAAAWPETDPDDPPLRPLQMFHPPQPVDALAEAPDGRPRRFQWRRVSHRIALAEGPERIAGEWWRDPDMATRDYYRVEDEEGRRFWLFRQGLYGETPEPRWFIHGLFA